MQHRAGCGEIAGSAVEGGAGISFLCKSRHFTVNL